MKIRSSNESDRAAIDAIHRSAFGPKHGPEIATLVADLFEDPSAAPLLSLVAETEGGLTGHILFSAARIEPSPGDVSACILAPLAVQEDLQREGIGGALIVQGLKQLTESGVDLVFVLGHPAYYPKFGFQTAGLAGLQAPYEIPPQHAEAWMVQELKAGVIGNVEGTVQCSHTLNDPRHWRE